MLGSCWRPTKQMVSGSTPSPTRKPKQQLQQPQPQQMPVPAPRMLAHISDDALLRKLEALEDTVHALSPLPTCRDAVMSLPASC